MYVPANNESGLLIPQSSIYPGVPPDIDRETLPSAFPLQLILFTFSTVEILLGSVIIIESTELQLLVSVTVTVYIPDERFDSEAVVSPVLQR